MKTLIIALEWNNPNVSKESILRMFNYEMPSVEVTVIGTCIPIDMDIQREFPIHEEDANVNMANSFRRDGAYWFKSQLYKP